jgi:hypothetical protein
VRVGMAAALGTIGPLNGPTCHGPLEAAKYYVHCFGGGRAGICCTGTSRSHHSPQNEQTATCVACTDVEIVSRGISSSKSLSRIRTWKCCLICSCFFL